MNLETTFIYVISSLLLFLKIVAGVRDLNTVGKLLDAPDLTLSRAIEICKVEEIKRAEELKARGFSRGKCCETTEF